MGGTVTCKLAPPRLHKSFLVVPSLRRAIQMPCMCYVARTAFVYRGDGGIQDVPRIYLMVDTSKGEERERQQVRHAVAQSLEVTSILSSSRPPAHTHADMHTYAGRHEHVCTVRSRSMVSPSSLAGRIKERGDPCAGGIPFRTRGTFYHRTRHQIRAEETADPLSS